MNNRREINRLAVEIIEGTHEIVSHKTTNNNAQKIFSLSLPIELNENQQIVIDWLKAYADSDNGDSPISSFWYMLYLIGEDLLEERVRSAYFELTIKQHFEVLQAFAEWGLNHERN